jgi:acyl-coenzyme A synthetase/AMP-(fatty) acid ligase
MSCLEGFETYAKSTSSGGNSEALRVEGSSEGLTFKELDDRASALASHLVVCSALSTAASPSSTPLVSILMQRHTGLVVAMLAVLKAGAAYVPVDPAFPPDRQSYIFEHSKSCLLLADEDSYREALSLGVAFPPVVVVSKEGRVVTGLRVDRNYSDKEVSALLSAARERQRDREGGGLMYVLYTSGSTGKPKGIIHTTGGYMVWAATTFKNVFDYRESDVYWCTADCGWITGHSNLAYGAYLSTACVVWCILLYCLCSTVRTFVVPVWPGVLLDHGALVPCIRCVLM